ncbi:glycosyltransferase [Agromyces sp. SYSU K20354]|uniref:glycosyltransferase family 2 protein n=1 Tax=Agromyces cavernae TaxID=2898659 RepID=UPI001E2D4A49|nr:glycosyltransferase [Agromyces cavernae]MCD2441014.1 glycosyltransferase [Agromyces cavernae]
MRAPLSTVVVIATFQRPEYVEECLAHLERQTVSPDRIVVVDASPNDLTHEVVTRHPGVEYRRNPLGVGHTATSRAIGVEGAEEQIIAFIDDDAYADADWLERLLEPYADAGVAAVGGRARNGQPDEEHDGIGQIGLLLPDGRLTGYFAAAPDRAVEVDHMLGANMSVRASVVRELGGIRDFYPGTCLREETDIALRMRRRGLRIVYTPFAVVEHVGGRYARGRRFDSRYRYFGARNHVVLLATTLGWRDPHVRTYGRTVLRMTRREVIAGLRALKQRDGARAKLRGLGGAVQRASLDLVGTVAGVAAALRATSGSRRRGSPA